MKPSDIKPKRRKAMRILTLLALMLPLILTACDKAPQQTHELQYSSAPTGSAVPVYRFAIHPLHNPRKLIDAYQPLMDHLNAQLQGARLELEASRDYQAYEEKFLAREPEFLLPNPWQTLQAIKVGYHVIAMAGDAEDFKGIFIVRKDSGIKKPADLKGKVVSYPSHTALAAAIMPQYYLHTHGVNVNTDIKNNYVGSQESSIMNVYLKKSAAGATWPPPWRLFQKDHPDEAAQLEVTWETPPLMNNSVMMRDDVPADLRDQVKKILGSLDQTPQGRAILVGMETSRFHPADDASYQPVQEYITRFERDVRPVEKR
jgi:phosphonate transport system substrate-binding protein